MDPDITNFEYILESNDPDKDFEYFWMSLKEIINKLSNNILKNQINLTSNLLNSHKKKKEYTIIFYKINDFLKRNIHDIISVIIEKYIESSNNINIIDDIIFVINKWKKISPTFNSDLMEINLLKYVKLTNDNNSDVVKEIYNCIKSNNNNILLNYAIDNENVFLIDILRQNKVY